MMRFALSLLSATALVLPALAQPAQWNYSVDPNTGNAVANYPGQVSIGGLPERVNVLSFGARGDGVTDDGPAFGRAVASLFTNGGRGGIVFFPPAKYCVATPLVVMNQGVTLQGAQRRGTSILDACGHDNTIITMSGFHDEIMGLTVNGPTNTNTVNDTLTIAAGCTECTLWDSVFTGGRHAINSAVGEFWMFFSEAFQSYGSSVFYSTGGGHLVRNKLDQSWPVSLPTAASRPAIAAWSAGAAFNTGDLVSTGGFTLQASAGGTTGSVAPVVPSYGSSVVDGTATWKLVGPNTYFAIECDTGCGGSLNIEYTDTTGDYSYNMGIRNTLAGTAPSGVFVTQSVFGQSQYGAVLISSAANQVSFENSTFGSCIFTTTCNIWDWTSTAATGQFSLVNNQFGTAGNYAANVPAGVSQFNIIGNRFIGASGGGINVAAGNSNRYMIGGNYFAGTVTPQVTDGGTGTDKAVMTGTGGSIANKPIITTGISAPSSTPADPAGTASGTLTMQGLGCTITPTISTRVRLSVRGVAANSVPTDGATINLREGTGTAPTNGAALAGTGVGSTVQATSATAGALVPFVADGIVTGLTLGTAYWFDLALANITGGTATLTKLSCSSFEL